MAEYKGFIGGSYELDSLPADAQRTINLIPETIESGTGKGPSRMFVRPGLDAFVDFGSSTPTTAIVEMLEVIGTAGTRVFALLPHSSGEHALWEVFDDATFVQLTQNFANIATSMASNGSQIVIATHDGTGSTLYCLELATNTLNLIDTLTGHAIEKVLWHPDGYFIGLDIDNKKFYISSLMDGTLWDATDTAQIFVTDRPVDMIEDHKQLWFFGSKGAVVYYDSGNPDFPFEPISGASLQTGIVGQTARRIDNTLMWVSQNERGGYQVMRANGFTPIRVSNNHIELQIAAAQPSDSDFSVWTMDYMGHAFYAVSVTGLSTTFIFDAATNLWSEWSSGLSPSNTLLIGKNHIFAWGVHLFSSTSTNKIYAMNANIQTDGGSPFSWSRRAPHLASERRLITYSRLELEIETGISGSSSPQIYMRYSDDGGRNWGTAVAVSMGSTNETKQRVAWDRLGSARDRVFEVYGSDQVYISIVTAFIDFMIGRH